MALERQTTGGDIILIGRQSARGTHITGDTVFQGMSPDWSDLNNITAALIKRRFPYLRNTLDPNAETAASEAIYGNNAAARDQIVKRGAAGEWEFEVRPEDIIHLLLGWFNPNPLPENTAIISRGTDGTIPAGKITLAAAENSKQTISLDNTGNSPPIADTWPGQLNIKFPATSTLDGEGTVTVYGEQRQSRSNNYNSSVTDTFSAKATDLKSATGVTSKQFLRKANRIVLSGFDTFAAPTEAVTLTFKADTNHAVLTLNALRELFAGWSTQMLKAGTPYIGYDLIVDFFRLNVTNTTMSIVLGLLASYVQEGRVLLKPDEVAYKLPKFDRPETGKTDLAAYETTAESQTDQKEVLDNYDFDSYHSYPSHGTAVALGEPGQELSDLVDAVADGTATIVPITSIETVGSHNYGDPEGLTGDPIGGEPTTREGETRTVEVNATIIHQTDQTYSDDNETVFWQDRYFKGIEIPIIVRHYDWEANGRQNLIEHRYAKCSLNQVPALPSEGQGQVNRTLAFSASPTNASGTNLIEMHIYSKGGFSES